MRTRAQYVLVAGALIAGACTIGDDFDRPLSEGRNSALYDVATIEPGTPNPFANGTVTDRRGEANGGMLVAQVGDTLSTRGRAEALAAEYRALEYNRPDQPVTWRNPDNGNYGEASASGAFYANHLYCRNLTHTVYVGGRPKVVRGVACRRVDRTWRIVG